MLLQYILQMMGKFKKSTIITMVRFKKIYFSGDKNNKELSLWVQLCSAVNTNDPSAIF